jgi:hypothetical protein
MAPKSDADLGEKLVVRRGRVDSVDLYEVKENELELLEKGSPASLQLNFSIFLLSIAFSAILTLTTATVSIPLLETTYVVVAVVGLLVGFYLLLSWYRTQKSIAKVIATIRKRIPPEVLRELEEPKKSPLPGNDQAPAG